jgi:hypothetical protein
MIILWQEICGGQVILEVTDTKKLVIGFGMDKVLIIEGTTDTTNGDLRMAFARLLEQKLRGKMPRIIMGNGVKKTVDKFLNQPQTGQPFLLIDLDAETSQRDRVLQEYDLVDKAETVFFMIQEMEAWFLSQPNVLKEYYQEDFSKKFNRPPQSIASPCEELQRITKQTKKGAYHKVKHGVALLPRLDLTALCSDFDDVKNLINQLS